MSTSETAAVSRGTRKGGSPGSRKGGGGPHLPLPVKLLGLGLAAYALYHRTHWYREGNRLFYAGRRPNRAGRAFGEFWVKVSSAGLGPDSFIALETIGHRTGRRSSIPLVVADHAGCQYLVSMLGEHSPWVHNVRAAGGRVTIRHGSAREVQLVEVPASERAPILKAYLARAVGGRPHIPVRPDAPLAEFEAIAADYPVFRIDPLDPDPIGAFGGSAGVSARRSRAHDASAPGGAGARRTGDNAAMAPDQPPADEA